MEKYELAHGIFLYRNAIMPMSVKELDHLQLVESSVVQYGEVVKNDSLRKCATKTIFAETFFDDIPNPSFLNNIDTCVTDYTNYFNVPPLSPGAWIFARYEKDGHFVEHVDASKEYPRVLSVVAYLNDNYEGGTIAFSYHNIEFKPQAGDVLIFPSNFAYPHIVYPVTKGIRLAMMNWYEYE